MRRRCRPRARPCSRPAHRRRAWPAEARRTARAARQSARPEPAARSAAQAAAHTPRRAPALTRQLRPARRRRGAQSWRAEGGARGSRCLERLRRRQLPAREPARPPEAPRRGTLTACRAARSARRVRAGSACRAEAAAKRPACQAQQPAAQAAPGAAAARTAPPWRPQHPRKGCARCRSAAGKQSSGCWPCSPFGTVCVARKGSAGGGDAPQAMLQRAGRRGDDWLPRQIFRWRLRWRSRVHGARIIVPLRPS